MKTTFLLLLFLVSSPLRQKEACTRHQVGVTVSKDSAPHALKGEQLKLDEKLEKQPIIIAFRHDEKKQPDYDLAIVGGGPQAVSVIVYLWKSGLMALRVVVIETKGTFATGRPYDPNIATDVHLINVFTMDEIAVTGNGSDIQQWFQDNHPKILEDYLEAIKARRAPQPPPRILFGRYLVETFDHFVDVCGRLKGYKISLMNDTTAETISIHPGGIGYVIGLDKGAPIHTRDVFVATGHFDTSRFKDPPKGYYKSPWPASDLLDEDTGLKEEHIGSLGNSLTSVDGLFTAAHKFGYFNADNTVYKTYANPSDFKMTMYSRGGQLPTVQRYLGEMKMYHPIYMISDNKDLSSDGGYDIRKFDYFFSLLKLDIVELLPNFPEKEKVFKMPAKDFFAHLDKIYKETFDLKQIFIDDVQNKPNPLHSKLSWLFHHADDFFKDIMEDLSAEEYAIYQKYLASRIKKAGTSVPRINAKKLVALMEKHLSLVAVGDGSKITEKEDGRGVYVTYWGHRPIPHNYFIEATGQNGYIRKDSRNFTQSLLESGLAQPYRIPFRDQVRAALLSLGLENDEAIDRRRIVQDDIDGKFYYEGDGVIMDIGQVRVVPRPRVKTDGSIYASPPFTFGYFPGAQTFKNTAAFACFAVENMEREWKKRNRQVNRISECYNELKDLKRVHK